MNRWLVDSGIPIPTARRAPTPLRPTLLKMIVGESILFDDERNALSFRAAGYRLRYRMSVRKMPDGWRVWRTA